MIIRVLGCSGAIAAGCKTTAFLIDHNVLVDAGTGVGDLALPELVRIQHIVLSHSHLDHVVSIALLADSVMRQREAQALGPIEVHGLPETLTALHQHIFNGVIWPDFTKLPTAARPILKFVPFAVGDVLTLCDKRVEVLSAAHSVPAVGFAVDGGSDGWWVFTGDTGPNPLLWSRLGQMKVAHLVIETAFGDGERDLARISRHLCPAELGKELLQLQGSISVHVTHIKPGETEAVMGEIAQLEMQHQISALRAGKTFELL
jgi:ribonuclease BN (tRNA processing enzyme)